VPTDPLPEHLGGCLEEDSELQIGKRFLLRRGEATVPGKGDRRAPDSLKRHAVRRDSQKSQLVGVALFRREACDVPVLPKSLLD
jgi:hypothetical protein